MVGVLGAIWLTLWNKLRNTENFAKICFFFRKYPLIFFTYLIYRFRNLNFLLSIYQKFKKNWGLLSEKKTYFCKNFIKLNFWKMHHYQLLSLLFICTYQ